MAERELSPLIKKRNDILQSIGGAYIFGISLMYTMEVWWIGLYEDFVRLYIFLLFTLGVSFFIGRFAGLSTEKGVKNNFFKAAESFLVGLFAAGTGLLVLNQLDFRSPPQVIINQLLIMVIPFSIGAFLSDTIFPVLESRKLTVCQSKTRHPLQSLALVIAATVAGGFFLGFPPAPTEEPQKLAVEMTIYHETALIFYTLALSYIITFVSSPKATEHKRLCFLEKPVIETLLAYTMALLLSLTLLELFDQISLTQDSPRFILSLAIVLSFPIAIGGAAGRVAA